MIRELQVLSFHPNDIGAADNSVATWISGAEWAIQCAAERNPDSVQTRTIQGFTLQDTRETDDSYVYLVSKYATPIGVLLLFRNDDFIWSADTIGVLSEYKGHNLGTLLHETALSDLGKLGSATSLSAGGAKLWKSLVTRHKGTYVIPGKYSVSHRPIEVLIKDWVLDGNITYPVLSTSKGPRSLKDIIDSPANPKERDAAKEGYYLIKAFGGGTKPLENWPF